MSHNNQKKTIFLKESYPKGKSLSQEFPLFVFDNFVDEQSCETFIELAESELKPSILGSVKKPILSEMRTGQMAWIKHDIDPLCLRLGLRISALIGLDLVHAEPFQVIHYGPRQEYKEHYDAHDLKSAYGKEHTQKAGQRLVTALIYLRDVPGGGGTAFPKIGLEVEAKKGRMLLFHNCLNDHLQRQPLSMHAGLPVAEGEKWAANLWFHERVYQKIIE